MSSKTTSDELSSLFNGSRMVELHYPWIVLNSTIHARTTLERLNKRSVLKTCLWYFAFVFSGFFVRQRRAFRLIVRDALVPRLWICKDIVCGECRSTCANSCWSLTDRIMTMSFRPMRIGSLPSKDKGMAVGLFVPGIGSTAGLYQHTLGQIDPLLRYSKRIEYQCFHS